MERCEEMRMAKMIGTEGGVRKIINVRSREPSVNNLSIARAGLLTQQNCHHLLIGMRKRGRERKRERRGSTWQILWQFRYFLATVHQRF